jgi:diguanylate cyclase (GGDEF)-like protein
MMETLAIARTWLLELLARVPRKRGTRVLVHEIVSIQVISAALIGLLAIATLYWGGQWILQDNYSRWALQWTDELNELGSPLYLADGEEAVYRLESYVKRYPEIERVAYYSADGSALLSVGFDEPLDSIPDLSKAKFEKAMGVIGNPEPYIMTTGFLEPQRFEILAPLWKEALPEGDLFDFDPAAEEAAADIELLGFVSLNLDFVIFHDRLLANIRTAILVLLFLLITFSFYGRHALRKALSSISDLQEPIHELAKGNLSVKFEPAEHREIAEIVQALETTASALNERDAELLELANHDSLTGLFNRRRFLEVMRSEITNVMNTQRESALLFIDLDQFKYINDACGHPAGDRLIRKVGDELIRSTRREDTVARFGGDEFAILLPKTDLDGAKTTANSILTNMRRMAHIEDERVFHVHCSIGITLISGSNLHHDDLINQADIACREAKSGGRNRMHIFKASEEVEAKASADIGWMNRLRNAIDYDSFELRFQPINSIKTGATMHHEVLIRLRGEDGNVILPDAFLPAAARFGLMSEIDFWMIERTAQAYADCRRSGNPLKLAINLSANAFEDDNLNNFIRKMFKKYSVIPGDIIIEITESLAIRRPLHVDQQIKALRKLGCEFALDDFGTGYSSFSYLQQLQFDYIKIDGAFVEDLLDNPVDQKMIRLIAEIGAEAGMKTVAEYVQNAKAFELLGELGVDLAQGFFVGRPTEKPIARTTPISLQSHRDTRSAS